MGRVGVLPATSVQELLLLAQRHERIEHLLFCASRNETAAEPAQNGGIEARVSQLQSQQVLPVNAAADRVGHPAVGQVLGKLGQGHKSQPPRTFGWLPATGEDGSKLSIGEDCPEPVKQA
jgi:hypothetical protein